MEKIKRKLREARKLRVCLQQGHVTSTDDEGHRKLRSFGSQNYRLFALNEKAIWFLSGIALVIASVIITWSIGPGQKPVERLYNLDLLESHQTSAIISLSAEQLETRVTDLIERVDMLAVSMARLESSLVHAQGFTGSIVEQKIAYSTTPEVPAISKAVLALEALPPPVSGQIIEEVSVAKTPRQIPARGTTRPRDAAVIAVNDTTSPAALPRTSDSVTHETPVLTSPSSDSVADSQSVTSKPFSTATSPDKEGLWVINLVSSTSKADADRWAKKAMSRGIQTEHQQVTIKGKKYWRVQITGFSTWKEARAYTGTTKEKLGVKNVWIARR